MAGGTGQESREEKRLIFHAVSVIRNNLVSSSSTRTQGFFIKSYLLLTDKSLISQETITPFAITELKNMISSLT